jgi:predicted dehydrogenase
MAAKAGVHVMCEKPIEVSLADAEAMHDVCLANKVNFMTAFPSRFSPSAVATKNLLTRGELGRILEVTGINHSEIPREHRAWFAQKALAGGGAVMDHTVHLVDLMRWLFECDVAEVYAEVDNLFYPGEVDVDTAGIAIITMANGVIASVDCSWSRPTYYPRWGNFRFDMIGENGFTMVDPLKQYHTVYSKTAPRNPMWVGWGSDSDQVMVNEFVASIREMREPSVTWNDGYQALRVALACYESSEKGQPVKL